MQEENMELKRRKSSMGETLEWTDYMSLTFTQHVRTYRHTYRVSTEIASGDRARDHH
jgi:hypothetical protein